jgi:hypothetical protein
MANFFKREALLMVLWPLLIIAIGLVAAVLVPIFLRHRPG